MNKLLICLSSFFICCGFSSMVFPIFISDIELALFLSRIAAMISFIIAAIFEFFVYVPKDTSSLIDDIDDKNFSLDDILKSKEFWEGYARQVEKDTWGKNKPKVYMRTTNGQKEIVAHYRDGTIEVLSIIENNGNSGELRLD